MNRPFSAFGVLLSLLAVTMFAVSSTSRSTTVKPAAERANRAAVRRPIGYPHFDVGVAAANRDGQGDAGQDEGLCSPGSFEEGVQGSGFRVQESEDSVLDNATPSRLVPVQIEAIQDAVSWVAPEPMDVRSLYDAFYDWVVMGEDRASSIATTDEPVRELSDEELTGLFHSILSSGGQPVSGISQRNDPAAAEAGKSRTGSILPALQSWIRHQAGGIWGQAVQSETVGWDDYAELVDTAQQHENTSTDIASISVGE